MSGVSPTKGNLFIGEVDQPMVGDGDTVGVTAEVAKRMFRAAEGTFRVDHPILAEQWAEPRREGLGLSKGYQVSVKAELALSESVPESGHELAAKNPAEDFDWKKEGVTRFDQGVTRFDPASVIG